MGSEHKVRPAASYTPAVQQKTIQAKPVGAAKPATSANGQPVSSTKANAISINVGTPIEQSHLSMTLSRAHMGINTALAKKESENLSRATASAMEFTTDTAKTVGTKAWDIWKNLGAGEPKNNGLSFTGGRGLNFTPGAGYTLAAAPAVKQSPVSTVKPKESEESPVTKIAQKYWDKVSPQLGEDYPKILIFKDINKTLESLTPATFESFLKGRLSESNVDIRSGINAVMKYAKEIPIEGIDPKKAVALGLGIIEGESGFNKNSASIADTRVLPSGKRVGTVSAFNTVVQAFKGKDAAQQQFDGLTKLLAGESADLSKYKDLNGKEKVVKEPSTKSEVLRAKSKAIDIQSKLNVVRQSLTNIRALTQGKHRVEQSDRDRLTRLEGIRTQISARKLDPKTLSPKDRAALANENLQALRDKVANFDKNSQLLAKLAEERKLLLSMSKHYRQQAQLAAKIQGYDSTLSEYSSYTLADRSIEKDFLYQVYDKIHQEHPNMSLKQERYHLQQYLEEILPGMYNDAQKAGLLKFDTGYKPNPQNLTDTQRRHNRSITGQKWNEEFLARMQLQEELAPLAASVAKETQTKTTILTPEQRNRYKQLANMERIFIRAEILRGAEGYAQAMRNETYRYRDQSYEQVQNILNPYNIVDSTKIELRQLSDNQNRGCKRFTSKSPICLGAGYNGGLGAGIKFAKATPEQIESGEIPGVLPETVNYTKKVMGNYQRNERLMDAVEIKKADIKTVQEAVQYKAQLTIAQKQEIAAARQRFALEEQNKPSETMQSINAWEGKISGFWTRLTTGHEPVSAPAIHKATIEETIAKINAKYDRLGQEAQTTYLNTWSARHPGKKPPVLPDKLVS